MTRSGGLAPDDRSEPSQKPRDFFAGWIVSAGAHIAVVVALLWFHIARPNTDAAPSQIIVSMMEEDGEPPGSPGASDDVSGAPQEVAAPEPVMPLEQAAKSMPTHEPMDTAESPPPDTSDILTDAQLAGAWNADDEGAGGGAGSGGGGGIGGCNTARVLQQALRRDPMVQRAVVNAGRAGKAVMLWDGAWVRAADQDGRGLSGVRQALLWELAFAPDACRKKQMQGLVTLSLQDGTRFAIGADTWRWSDLLGLPKGARDR